MLAGAVVLVLALVALGGWFATRSAPVSGSGAPVPVAATAPVESRPAPETPAEPAAPPSPEPVAAPEPIAAASASATASVATASKPSARQSASEALPEAGA